MKKLILLFGLFLGHGVHCFTASGDEFTDSDVVVAMEEYGENKVSQKLVNYCDAQKSQDFYEKLLLRLAALLKGNLEINAVEGITALSFSKSHINKFDGFLTAKDSLFGISMQPKDGAFIRALNAAINQLREQQRSTSGKIGGRAQHVAEQEDKGKEKEGQYEYSSDESSEETDDESFKEKSREIEDFINQQEREEESNLNEDQKIALFRERIKRDQELIDIGFMWSSDYQEKWKIQLDQLLYEKSLRNGREQQEQIERDAEFARRVANQDLYEESLQNGFDALSTMFRNGESAIKNNNDLIRKMNEIGARTFGLSGRAN